jgi:polysaccharide export outer membrane protein
MLLLQLRTKILLISLIGGIIGQSCVGHKNMITLNQGEEVPDEIRGVVSSPNSDRYQPYEFQPYKIRPYDQLMIRVNAFAGSTEEFVNREMTYALGNSRRDFDPPSIYFTSYSVNDSGYISLPLVDKIKIAGLTTSEAERVLDKAYEPYLKLVSTNVKLANNRVTIMGEVSEPGVHYFYQDQNTLLDAIGLAGDFTDFANRKKVKIIRQTNSGSKSVYLNLNRSEFFASEYYYTQPNDMIYIEPVKAKTFDVSARSIGVVISSISLAAVIANLVIKQ